MPLRRLSALALIVAAAAACGRGEPPAAANTGPDGGTLVVAEPGDADNLMPPLTVSLVGHAVTDLVFDHLAEIGDSMHTVGDDGFKPRLADHWTWAPDSLSVAFHLNPNARWHDGVPVRASDVKFSLDLYKNPKVGSPETPLLANVDSMSVRDSLTAVAWFHDKTPEEFFDIAYQLWVVPKHVLDTIPPDKLGTSEAARHPIGSGRFRFASWEPGTRLEIVADTGNYRGRAKLDRVIWAITPDNNAAYTMMLGGQADLFENASPDQLKSAATHASLRPFPWPAPQYVFLGMNFRDAKHHAQPSPYFADLRVRRAVSMAIDRRAMLSNVFDSLGAIGYGPFPRSSGSSDTTLHLPAYDPAAAAALLDSAGWVRGADGMRSRNGRRFTVDMIVPNSSTMRMNYAVLIQEALRKQGIDVAIDAMPYSTFLPRQTAGDFDLVLAGYGVDPNATAVGQGWASASVPPQGFNYLSYASPKFDALLDSTAHAFDPAKAHDYITRAYETIVDDAPAVWLYDVVSYGLISRRFQMPPVRADGWWQHLADWTVPAADRIARDRIGLAAAKP
jgi:peptide/nickel transport system substrate-binding protein